MAFDKTKLSVLAYANGFTLFHYITKDDNTAIVTSGYANTAAAQLRVGDMILANVDTDGTPDAKMYSVSSNDGTTVVLVNQF
ncbi:MAG: hypothetical protein E6R03_10575 [Hyphomicrobiaceae bacterium]|nr:MAG: hypothetical protein E6R03_10575 [Hyphomicrobiaceae bacterium]